MPTLNKKVLSGLIYFSYLIFSNTVFSVQLHAQDTSKIFSFGFTYSLEKSFNDWIEIVSIFPNSPASRANIIVGDYITSVNQKPTSSITESDLANIFKAAKKAGSLKLKINDERELTLIPDTVALFKCVTGDCINGFGRKEDYVKNRIIAGNYRNGQLYGYASIKPYKGSSLPNRFKGFESYKVREIEGIFEGSSLLVVQNMWMDNVNYKGKLGANGPNGKGTFTDRGIIYEGNFNEQGRMDGEFTITMPNKTISKRIYKNTRVAPLYGFVNALGQMTVPAKYISVNSFSEGYALAETENDQLVIIDKKGNILGKMENYNEKGGFVDGLCAVGKNGKFGFVNTAGKLITPIIYERPKDYKYEMRENYPGPKFQNGVAVVHRAGKFGTIDTKGKSIIPLIYDAMQVYNGNFTVVTLNKLQGVADKMGNLILPIKYKQVWIEDGGSFFRVRKYEGRYTFSLFNTKGEEIPGTSDEHIIGKFENGYAFFENIISAKGIITSKGEKIKLLGDYYFDPLLKTFVNGMAVIEQNNKKGVVDTKGNTLIPFKFHYLELYDGIATVTENMQDINSTILDIKGNIIYKTTNTKRITMRVGSNMYFQGYIITVDDDKNLSILDKSGKLLYTAPKGAKIEYVDQKDIFLLSDNTGIVKFIKPDGKVICGFTHELLYYPGFKDGMAPVGAN